MKRDEGRKRKWTMLDLMGHEVQRQNNEESSKLNLFVAIEPEGVNAIQDDDRWELLTLYGNNAGHDGNQR